jgi:hypothetical protein
MTVSFGFPYAAPTTTIDLRNPDLGNIEALNVKTQFSQSMNGVLYSTRYTPAGRTLSLTFSSLTRAKMDEFQDFIVAATCQDVRYEDHDGNVWQGQIITNPNESVTTGPKDGTCIEVGTVSIQFEGVVTATPAVSCERLLEDGTSRLLEDSSNRLLEGCA